MSLGLLTALAKHGIGKRLGKPKDFTFQHKLCHDFESLIWVIVYAMMIRRRNVLVATDSSDYTEYMAELDSFWGVHSHSKLAHCREILVMAGIRPDGIVEDLLFSGPFEVEFFRAAMRLVFSQILGQEPITYEKMQVLFRTYIQKVEQATVSTFAPAESLTL
jgi:hypothetical protein